MALRAVPDQPMRGGDGFARSLDVYDAAKAATVYEAERKSLADRRDHMLSLVRNYLDPLDKRASFSIGDVTIRRTKRFVPLCECHRENPEGCDFFLAGCAVRFMRVEVEPSIWATAKRDGAA